MPAGKHYLYVHYIILWIIKSSVSSLDTLGPVAADGRNELKKLGSHFRRHKSHRLKRLKANSTLVSDIAERIDKAVPVADEVSARGETGIRDKMKVVKTVIIVDVEICESVPECFYKTGDILTGYDRVSDVEAEAEYTLTRLTLKRVKHLAGPVGRGESALNKSAVISAENVFKQNLDTVFLCRGYKASVLP